MSRLRGISSAFEKWVLTHKWEYRAVWLVLMGLLFFRHLFDDGPWTKWDWIGTLVYLFMFSVVFYVWWRLDVLEEFEQHVIDAIGDRAIYAALVARMHLTTTDVRMLNHVMKRYDIMKVHPMDLPPEGKALREILDDLTK